MADFDDRNLNDMHKRFGIGPAGATCGDCMACVDERRSHATRGSIAVYVCRSAPSKANAHGETRRKRWKKSWQACGHFQAGGA